MGNKKVNSDLEVLGSITTDGVQQTGGGTSTDVFFTDGTTGPPTSITQQSLTDAATISWDFTTQPSAYLLATGAVGNSRTIPNSILTNGVNGDSYQLIFQQDTTGGRSIAFDTNFEVVGVFDERANKASAINILVQDGIGYAIISSWEGLPQTLSNVGTGEQILIGDTLKSLKGGTNVTLSSTATEITIDAAAGGGGSAFVPYYVFVDRLIGNDSTGELENPDKPFLTITAAQNALPAWVQANPDHWSIEIINEGTYTFPATIPNRNITYKSDHRVIFQAVSVTRATQAQGIYTFLTIDIPKGDMIITNQANSTSCNCRGCYLTLIARKYSVTTSGTNSGQGFTSVSGCYIRVQHIAATYAAIGGIFDADLYWYDNKSNSADIYIGHLEGLGNARAATALIWLGRNTESSGWNSRHKVHIGFATITSGRVFALNDTILTFGSCKINAGITNDNRPMLGWIYGSSEIRFTNSFLDFGASSLKWAMLDCFDTCLVTGRIRDIKVNYNGATYFHIFRIYDQGSIADLNIRKVEFLGSAVPAGGNSNTCGVFSVAMSGHLEETVGTWMSNVVISELIGGHAFVFDEFNDSYYNCPYIHLTGHNYFNVPTGYSAFTSTVTSGTHEVRLRGKLRTSGGGSGFTNGVTVAQPTYAIDL